jgi:hypothetical protein
MLIADLSEQYPCTVIITFFRKRKKPRATSAQDHPLKICFYQTARFTLPDLRQLVHTEAFLTLPLSLILTVWILAFHFLFVWMLE